MANSISWKTHPSFLKRDYRTQTQIFGRFFGQTSLILHKNSFAGFYKTQGFALCFLHIEFTQPFTLWLRHLECLALCLVVSLFDFKNYNKFLTLTLSSPTITDSRMATLSTSRYTRYLPG